MTETLLGLLTAALAVLVIGSVISAFKDDTPEDRRRSRRFAGLFIVAFVVVALARWSIGS